MQAGICWVSGRNLIKGREQLAAYYIFMGNLFGGREMKLAKLVFVKELSLAPLDVHERYAD